MSDLALRKTISNKTLKIIYTSQAVLPETDTQSGGSSVSQTQYVDTGIIGGDYILLSGYSYKNTYFQGFPNILFQNWSNLAGTVVTSHMSIVNNQIRVNFNQICWATGQNEIYCKFILMKVGN